MELTFQPATPAELATAVAIARAASASPYSHWDADYPNEAILAEDIARGELYLLREDGVPRAMISILDEALECNLVHASSPWYRPRSAGTRPCSRDDAPCGRRCPRARLHSSAAARF